VLSNLNAFSRYQYTGSQLIYVASANANQKSAAFHTLDLGTNYNPIQPLTLKLGMNNLTNTKRDEVATAADTVLQGRTVTAGFAYQL
jgi:outer membrane receptor for ferrienterochelin and colicins